MGSTVNATGNLLFQNEFTGALAFGGLIQLGDNQIECNPLDLVHEKYQGVLGAFQGLGGNECSCAGIAHDCTAASSSIEPPEGIDEEE
jgi:hypothetical protein